MNTYAKATNVSIARTKEQIAHELQRFGADKIATFESATHGAIAFELQGVAARLDVPVPDTHDYRFVEDSRYANGERERSDAQMEKAWRQACRERWRALHLLVKAKLVAIECGQVSVERAFMGDLLLPGGKTVAELIEKEPAWRQALITNKPPPLLPGAAR